LSDNENFDEIPIPEAADDLAKRAVSLFENGLDCETAVVTVFDQLLGTRILDGFEPKIRRIGLGFHVPCGALLGARRVLAQALSDDGRSARLAQELEEAFVHKHRSTTCQYLTARVKWGEHHLHCGKYVRTVAVNLWSLLEEELGQHMAEALKSLDIQATKH
jgi:hypothetical protein